MIEKKQLWIWTGILLAVMFAMSFALNEGWLDAIAAHTAGLVAYWVVTLAVCLYLVFGVFLPWMRYLSQSDSPLARFLTGGMRRRKQHGRRE